MKCPNCYNDVRDTAKFCPHCGHEITAAQKPPAPNNAAQKTQLVRPRADQPAPPPPARPPAAPPAPPAAPPAYKPPVYTPPGGAPGPGAVPPAQSQPARRGLRLPAWPLLAGLGVVLVLGLAALWFLFLRGGAAAGLPAGDRVLYVAEESPEGFGARVVAALDREGESAEIAFDRDGLWLGWTPAGYATGVSLDGRLALIYASDAQPRIMTTESGQERLQLEGFLSYSFARAFSPDSNTIAYTSVTIDEDDAERIELVAADAEGQETGRWADLVFAGFFNDSERVLAARVDDDGLISDLVTVTLPDGEPQRVASLDDSTDDAAPFVFGDRVYYRFDDELRRVDSNGENVETIYRFESDSPLVILLPGLDRLLILERSEDSDYGDLYVITADGRDRVRLDEDVTLAPFSNGSPGPTLAYAGGRLAYATIDRDSDLVTLQVINIDGSDRRRLVDDQVWLNFGFSPDGRRLAYIAGESAYTPGDLYVVEMPEGEPARLARDVWSFFFMGDHLLYATLDGLQDDDPESVVHRITVEGDDDEVIYGPEDGAIQFLAPVR